MATFREHLRSGLQFDVFLRFSLSDFLEGPVPSADPWDAALADMEECSGCGKPVDTSGPHEMFEGMLDNEVYYYHLDCVPTEDEDAGTDPESGEA